MDWSVISRTLQVERVRREEISRTTHIRCSAFIGNMDVVYLTHTLRLAVIPQTYQELCTAIEGFFAISHYQLLLVDRVTKESRPLTSQEYYASEQGIVVVQPSAHLFPWESLITQKSYEISDDSSEKNAEENSSVEQSLWVENLQTASVTYREAAVQTSEPLISQCTREAEPSFLFKCTRCRLYCVDNRLRRCLPCGFWLCAGCEDSHPPPHPILYYRREKQLQEDHC